MSIGAHRKNNMKPNIKILLVDDEPDILSLLQDVLKRRKYDVLTANSVINASKILDQNEDIDLVISDIKMPEGTGIDLLKKMREKDPIKPVLIFLTAFTDISVEDIYNRGASDFIEKPIDIKDFTKTIEDILKENAFCSSDICDKIPYKDEVSIKLKSLSEASLGTGGMFIPMDNINLRVQEIIKFEISFDSKGIPIRGIGKIAWVRRTSSQGPTGIGIKFINMYKDSQEAILKAIKQKGITSFIPIR